MTQEQSGVLIPQERKAFWFLSTLAIQLLTSEQTNNAFALQELTHPKGTEPPPHIHHEQDEVFHILEGEATIICGNQIWRASSGDYVFLPRGMVHAFQVEGEIPLKMEIITSPGGPFGFEHFVEEMGEPALTLTLPPAAPPDMQKLLTLAAKYQIELLPPK